LKEYLQQIRKCDGYGTIYPWGIFAIGIFYNFGALCMTYYALSIGYHEANGIMSILFKIGYGLPLIACALVWIGMGLYQRRMIKRFKNIPNKKHAINLLYFLYQYYFLSYLGLIFGMTCFLYFLI